ncbi:MAG: type III secretion system export apparatus subunit SctS [Kiloniellales bacterium]|nr:type III secretion system export apparatus subunit SctS [Kiloniellales bacterium]
MTEATLAHQVNTALVLTLLLSAPPLLIAAVVGLTVGLLQAITQIQDQSLPQVFKIIAILVALIFTGAMLVAPLIEFTDRILQEIAAVR